MGLWNRLFGWSAPAQAPQTQAAPPSQPRPKVLARLEDAPYVLLQTDDKTTTVMDVETFDYLYGERQGPDPAQGDLDELLSRARRVRVLAGGLLRGEPTSGEVLADCGEGPALTDLAACLRIDSAPESFNRCACFGGPTLELFDGERRLAVLGVQHGKAVRWRRWHHDAQLSSAGSLDRWLGAQGVDRDLLQDIYEGRYQPSALAREGGAPLSGLEQRLRRIDSRRLAGETEAARLACDELLREHPDAALGYAVRALAHQDEGDPRRCVADCTAALERGLRLPVLYFARAVGRDTLGLRQEAIADCTSALALAPDHAGAYNSRGLMHGQLGRTEEALADLGEAVRLAPRWALPRLNRGQVHQRRGDWDAALADFQELAALADEREELNGLSLRAVACWKQMECHRDRGDRASASAAYQEALRIDPDLEMKLAGREGGAQ